ncbi:MAG: hypothetical protein JNL32_02025 [Candidatus Kapabacteria bacterium]|nr:hypothetical protein [Candidatus Kapabacteria bacterium]
MNTIDYTELLHRYPWLVQHNQNCILSPDVDGLLCGLFMSHYYGWNIAGYYDGKQLLLRNAVSPSDCVFLDMEIYRNDIRSIGQHMVLYNSRDIPQSWGRFDNCINPNNIRGFDANKHFAQKYPFGTIHLLLALIRHTREVGIRADAITVLLYVDGTFKNLLNYPENCISWLNFLDAKNESSPLSSMLNIFAAQRISTMMHDLEKIFEEFRTIGGGKKGGDKIKLDGIDTEFSAEQLAQTENLLGYLATLTGWHYTPGEWSFTNLVHTRFEKGIIPIGKLNNRSFNEVLDQNPVSFAITGTKQIEYTLPGSHGIFSRV